MAITRRQFVTRLGALAAAIGMSQADLSKVTDAFAHSNNGSTWGPSWTSKPKVVWVHGAECTGCSTSLLGLFEDVRGVALEDGSGTTTLAALDLAVGGTGTGSSVLGPYGAAALGVTRTNTTGHPFGHRTLWETGASAAGTYGNAVGADFDSPPNQDAGLSTGTPYIANIADVLIDFIDLQYHETVMGMGGDLAYQWLKDNKTDNGTPFVLVVEGAVQDEDNTGYWNSSTSAGAGFAINGSEGVPWCSIGQDGNSGSEHGFDTIVQTLAERADCAAVIAIGQCASFGGYPACISPVMAATDTTSQAKKGSMTGAKGVYDFLDGKTSAAKAKVINVPGCPTNPWWFVLTVVAWLVDATAVLGGAADGPLGILETGLAIKTSAIDKPTTRRLKAVYGASVHGRKCPRYQDFLNGVFAQKPGDPGCLQVIGCKGPSTLSLCALHGWNATNPHNDPTWDYAANQTVVKAGTASFCVAGGHPCMGCTEKGYPDSFVPFVNR
jgi:hydrogenase small subunit